MRGKKEKLMAGERKREREREKSNGWREREKKKEKKKGSLIRVYGLSKLATWPVHIRLVFFS